MATYGRYGWTPEQMERINARRARRGQGELVNTIDTGGYAGRNEERARDSFNKYARSMGMNTYGQGGAEEQPQAKRKPAFPTDRPSALAEYKSQQGLGKRMAARGSMEDEAEERKEEFAKRFKPAGAMAIEKNVAAEAAKLNKRGKGISTPSLQGSFNRFTATA
jgi:hypothetical protein